MELLKMMYLIFILIITMMAWTSLQTGCERLSSEPVAELFANCEIFSTYPKVRQSLPLLNPARMPLIPRYHTVTIFVKQLKDLLNDL